MNNDCINFHSNGYCYLIGDYCKLTLCEYYYVLKEDNEEDDFEWGD